MPGTAISKKNPPKRILVVDDEPQVAQTIRMVLVMGGHTVDITDSAASALELYEAGKYDLIISDYSLGQMNGLELARLIKERCATQPFILITAYAESMALNQEKMAHIDYLMSKPFPLTQLQEALDKVFSAA
jgi:two-component system, NtrC family, response regulator HydG